MLLRFPLLALVAVLTALAVVPAGDSSARLAGPDQVFVLAGQSNMRGRGMPLSEGSPSDPRLLDWHATDWAVASDPLAYPPASDDGIGPGMTFGLDAIADLPTTVVGLVQCAIGSTPSVAWTPGGYAYEACLGQLSAAGGLVSGLLYLQGETDSQKRYKALSWREHFEELLAGFRSVFGPEVPVMLAEIGKLNPENFPYQKTVRDAQVAAAAEDYKVVLIHTDDLPTDGLHFTTDAFKILGHRFADAWWALTNGNPPPPPPDFTIDASPDSTSLPAGQTFQYTVSYTALNGFVGTPVLDVEGLPAAAKATFSPPTLSGGGTSTLTITTTWNKTPPGDVPLTITGTNVSLSRTTPVDMDVLPPIPDFQPVPTSKKKILKLSKLKPAVFKFKLDPVLGYTGTITPAVAGLPPSASGAFVAPTAQIVDKHAAGESYTLTIAPDTPTGTYPLTFTFTDGTLTHQVTTQLIVGP